MLRAGQSPESVPQALAAAAAPGDAGSEAGWPEESYCLGPRGCKMARPAYSRKRDKTAAERAARALVLTLAST